LRDQAGEVFGAAIDAVLGINEVLPPHFSATGTRLENRHGVAPLRLSRVGQDAEGARRRNGSEPALERLPERTMACALHVESLIAECLDDARRNGDGV